MSAEFALNELTSSVRGLISKLIGDVDRTTEQSDYTDPRKLPKSLGFERIILESIYACVHNRDPLPPTFENVVGVAAMRMKREQVEQRLVEILEEQSEARGTVKQYSFWVKEALRDVARIEVAQDIMKIAQEPTDDMTKHEKMLKKIASVAPESDNGSMLDEIQRSAEVRQHLREVVARVRAGKPAGPHYPFVGLSGDEAMGIEPKIQSLNLAEMSLWTALTGQGKSTLAAIIAEYLAWILGYDVLFIHLETTHESFQMRQWARRLLIPTAAMKAGRVDPDMPEWKPKFDQFDAALISMAATKGRIVYQHKPGWDTVQIYNEIALQRKVSEARGRELLVIIDYFQAINWRSLHNEERVGLSLTADALKEAAEKQNVHIITFAQAAPNDPFEPFGSGHIKKRSQIHIAVVRGKRMPDGNIQEYAQEDWRVEEKGKELKNALGFPRYWHRKGDWNAHARLVIVKANDDGIGECPIVFENELFRVQDNFDLLKQQSRTGK